MGSDKRSRTTLIFLSTCVCNVSPVVLAQSLNVYVSFLVLHVIHGHVHNHDVAGRGLHKEVLKLGQLRYDIQKHSDVYIYIYIHIYT